MVRAIRFRAPWRHFAVGDSDSKLSPGVRDALVRKGLAVWIEPAPVFAQPKIEEEAQPKKSKRRD